jgi:hypothetical protein
MEATYIAPLNHVPAMFPILGESAGAGRRTYVMQTYNLYILQALCSVKITLQM